MICPSCGGEYRSGFTDCADCGVPLTEEPADGADGAPAPIDPEVELVTVFESADPALVTLAKSVLDSAQIEFLTRGGMVQELIGLGQLSNPVNTIAGPVLFQVRAEDAEEAISLLRDLPESALDEAALEEADVDAIAEEADALEEEADAGVFGHPGDAPEDALEERPDKPRVAASRAHPPPLSSSDAQDAAVVDSPARLLLFKISALCAFVSGVTALLLARSTPLPEAFDEASLEAFYRSRDYAARHWLFLVHALVLFIVYLGIATRLKRRSRLLCTLGLFFALFWLAATLLIELNVLYFISDSWLPASLVRGEPKPGFVPQLEVILVVGRRVGIYRVITLSLASLCFALAAWRGGRADRFAGFLLLLSAGWALSDLTAYVTTTFKARPPADWIYAIGQALLRCGLGVWLWKSLASARARLAATSAGT